MADTDPIQDADEGDEGDEDGPWSRVPFSGESTDQEADEADEADEKAGEDVDDQEMQPEVVEAEVLEDDAPEEVEDLPVAEFNGTEISTFTANFGAFSFKLIPQSTGSGLEWAVWVFSNNVQGPIFQTKTPISEAEAAEFGIPESLRNRINDGLTFARESLTLPSELRQELKERSLEDLEALMEEAA